MEFQYRSETQRRRIEGAIAERLRRRRAGGVASGEARRRSQALRDAQIRALHKQGLAPLEIAEQVQCGRTTVYESLRRQREEALCSAAGPGWNSLPKNSQSEDEEAGKADGRRRGSGVLRWFHKIKLS